MSAHPSPSGDQDRGGGVPLALTIVVTVILIVRLVAAAKLHLTEDEAYYRLWSNAPAFGYYDHPPMIAWWVWLGRRIAGDNALGVRLLPILANVVTSVLVFDLARVTGGTDRVAQRAGIWFNAMLLTLAGGFLAVPDAPAGLFWVTTIWCVARALRASSTGWWAAAGLAAGLALLSKYSALFLGPGILIWLACTRRGRAELRRPGPWIAAALAAALFSANILWNAGHQWLTFHKQFGRLAVSRFEPRHLLEFLIEQVLLLNPLIAVFVAAAVVVRPRPEHQRVNLTPFFATCAPFAAYLTFHGLHSRVEAHWPAPLYPALAICAAAASERLSDSRGWRALATTAPVFGFALCGAFLVYMALPMRLVGGADVALPVRGWPAFASRLNALADQKGAGWVGATSYGLTAQLTTEPALRAPILQLAERDRWTRVTTGAAPDLTKAGLVVDLPRRVTAASLGRCFSHVEALGLLPRGAAGEPGTPYAVFVVSDPIRNIIADGC